MKKRLMIFGLITVLFSVFSFILLHYCGFEIMDSKFVILGYVVITITCLIFNFWQNRIKTLYVFLGSLFIYSIFIIVIHINHPIIYFKNLKIISKKAPYNWEVVSPSKFDIDSVKFRKVLNQMAEISSIRSVVVIKDGKLIGEKYFSGAKADYAMNIKSATKSITSTLVGIALHEGFIDSINQKVIDFFPEYRNRIKDPRKLKLTIKDILTMRSGYAAKILKNHDFTVENVFANIPMVEEAGITFCYHAPASQLIAGIIERASKMTFDEFANKYLYEPLGISCAYWQKLPDGLNQADCESYFTPRDLARIGYLYANNGVIDGKRILDSAFVNEATTDQVHSKKDLWQFDDCTKNDGYGYWFWTINSNAYNEFAARGAGGQNIQVIPELGLVIVMLRKHYSTEHLPPIKEKSYLQCDLISCFKKE
jgi:CubicO group peptidase (beta-lactamase class C family)